MSTIVLPQARLHDATILIVDDEETNVRFLARILERAGFTHVHTTTDSTQALRFFLDIAPDLIVLDVRMPHMDGFAVLAELRGHMSTTDFLPVLAITGDASSETRQRMIAAGAKDFLEKPFEAAEVVVRIDNLLTTRMLHRSLQLQNELLEQKVEQRTAELQGALAAAEEAGRAKSRFLATMSHELRTPLNAVIGFANHLKKNRAGNLQPLDVSLLQRIVENGSDLLQIINDVLDLSRVEAGRGVIEQSTVAIGDLVVETMNQITGESGRGIPRVAIRASLPPHLRPVLTDRTKLRRVLVNLIGNAVKFTDEGSVCVGIVADRTGRALRVDVVDTGIGIPAERLGAIFQMFEQADNTTQRRYGGTGLGLAISRALCELMGYRLVVVSELGVGSAFSVILEPTAETPMSYRTLASQYSVRTALAS